METDRLVPHNEAESNGYRTIDITSPKQPNAKPPRVVAIDLLRGLIMVFESIDHAKLILTTFYGEHETWYSVPHYDSWFQFFLRFLTHLCAPGFAFLAGLGVVFFSASRKRLGWSDDKLVHHFFVRGFLLVVLNMIHTFNWSHRNDWLGDQWFIIAVLFSLGVNFFLGAVLSLLSDHLHDWAMSWFSRRDTEFEVIVSREVAERKADTLRIGLLAGAAALLAAVVVALTPSPVPDGETNYSWLWYLIFLPGPNKYFYSIYPPMDWLSITIYGVAFGYVMIRLKYNNRQSAGLNLKIAVFFLLSFILIRTIGKFGNTSRSLFPSPPAGTFLDNPFLASPIAFLNVVKYPPDLAFITLFMGLNHLILSGFYLLPTDSTTEPSASRWTWLTEGPLLDFGRSALFFYFIHFYLYLSMAWVIGMVFPSTVNSEGHLALEWGPAAVAWIAGLVILWGLCKWYGRFKASKGPDSVWRFF